MHTLPPDKQTAALAFEVGTLIALRELSIGLLIYNLIFGFQLFWFCVVVLALIVTYFAQISEADRYKTLNHYSGGRIGYRFEDDEGKLSEIKYASFAEIKRKAMIQGIGFWCMVAVICAGVLWVVYEGLLFAGLIPHF